MTRIHRFGDDSNPLRRGLRLIGRRFGRRPGSDWRPSAETIADWEAIRTIPQSALVQVVGIGRTAVAADRTVDLLAIEVREQGAVLSWRERSAREGLLLSADVSISDDLGTAYHVIQGGGGGDSQAWEGQTFCIPSPPAGARMTITLTSFGPSDDRPLPPFLPTERVPGPWLFEVEMPPRDAGRQ